MKRADEKLEQRAQKYILGDGSRSGSKGFAEFARAELLKAAETAEKTPRSWDVDAPDPQHRIAAAIRKQAE